MDINTENTGLDDSSPDSSTDETIEDAVSELAEALENMSEEDTIKVESITKNIFDALQDEIMESDLPTDEKNRRLSRLLKVSNSRVNLMLVGATGAGKSSTINAMFNMDVAKVGIGVDPETKDIQKYELSNLTIWDTPGLGDSPEEDEKNINQIIKKLSEVGDDGSLLIDLVMVVLDASSKDMASNLNIINNVLIPCLGENNENRILIALNQSDMAMKGRHWNHELNAPEDTLLDFLKEKVKSVKRRIFNATSVEVESVCFYCAGYTDGVEKQNPYNLARLLYQILMAVPSEKRLVLVENLNEDDENWESNEEDFTTPIRNSFLSSLFEDVAAGVEKGAMIGGCALGLPGAVTGALIGCIVGGLKALVVTPIQNLIK